MEDWGQKGWHEWLRLGGASGEHPVQPPAAGYTGLCSGGFRIAAEKEAPCSRWEVTPGRQLEAAASAAGSLRGVRGV